MQKILRVFALFAGYAALAAGYWEMGDFRVAKYLLLAALLWEGMLRMRYLPSSSIGLGVALLAAAWGVWEGISPAWALAGVTSAFIAWDLTFYTPALPFHAPQENLGKLEFHHLVKLAILAALSLFFGTWILLSQGALSLWWEVVCLLYGVWIVALAWKGRRYRRQ